MATAKRCLVCQAVKPNHHPYPAGTLDFWPIPRDIFQSLAMDFLSLPPCDHAGVTYDYCLVIVDRLSGYIQAIPCRQAGLTAPDCAQLFLRHCVAFMGLPLEVLSDNDHLITSAFFQEMCSLLGIEQHQAVIYRPKGNGRAERAVRSVVDILRVTLHDHDLISRWVQVFSWCVFLQNSLPGVVAGQSPHKIVFGRELLYPGELPPVKEPGPAASPTLRKDLKLLRKDVQERLTREHTRQREAYNAKHREITYRPGDKVWLKVLPQDHSKLSRLWTGPHEVLRHVAFGKYEVASTRGPEIVHMDSLKPYCPPLKGECLRFSVSRPDPIPTRDEDTWIVERILRHRIHRGKLQWLVKWQDSETEIWAPVFSFISGTQTDWVAYNKKHKLDVSF